LEHTQKDAIVLYNYDTDKLLGVPILEEELSTNWIYTYFYEFYGKYTFLHLQLSVFLKTTKFDFDFKWKMSLPRIKLKNGGRVLIGVSCLPIYIFIYRH